MKEKLNKTLAVLLTLALCAALCGCAEGGIREDGIKEQLPAIDPETGVERDVSVTLYYRLSNEAYLVGVTRNIAIDSNERTENAIIRTLLKGTPALSNNVSALFPENTRLLDVALDGSILYVTLSGEFLDDSAVREAEEFAKSFLGGSALSNEEYERLYTGMVDAARADMYLERSLAVYSLVNTLSGYGGTRVQLLVDIHGTGAPVRVTRGELGISSGGEVNTELLEPLRFNDSVVVTPEVIARCMLDRMAAGQYELAYPLLSESDSEGQRPTYANFETEMLSLGTLKAYEMLSVRENDRDYTAEAELNVKFEHADGAVSEDEGVRLAMRREGDLYKVEYSSLKRILEG